MAGSASTIRTSGFVELALRSCKLGMSSESSLWPAVSTRSASTPEPSATPTDCRPSGMSVTRTIRPVCSACTATGDLLYGKVTATSIPFANARSELTKSTPPRETSRVVETSSILLPVTSMLRTRTGAEISARRRLRRSPCDNVGVAASAVIDSMSQSSNSAPSGTLFSPDAPFAGNSFGSLLPGIAVPNVSLILVDPRLKHVETCCNRDNSKPPVRVH